MMKRMLQKSTSTLTSTATRYASAAVARLQRVSAGGHHPGVASHTCVSSGSGWLRASALYVWMLIVLLSVVAIFYMSDGELLRDHDNSETMTGSSNHAVMQRGRAPDAAASVLMQPRHSDNPVDRLPFHTLPQDHPVLHLRHVVLTTFWGSSSNHTRGGVTTYTSNTLSPAPPAAAPSSFYHGRKVPSFKWVVAFLLSFFDVTPYPSSSPMKSSNASCQPSNISGKASGIVFFLDPDTLPAVLRAIMKTAQGRLLLQEQRGLSRPRLYFVVVSSEALVGEAALVSSTWVSPMMLIRMPRTTYMDTEWASSVGNGANNFRFAFYRDYLEAATAAAHTKASSSHACGTHEQDTSLVWVTDNTDVVFQADPFDLAGPCFPHLQPQMHSRRASQKRQEEGREGRTGLRGGEAMPWVAFTLEDGSKTFRNEKYNRRWMQCYGSRAVRELAFHRQRVSCAGVTYGNMVGMLRYTVAQVTELQQAALVRCAADVIHATLDQATHNMLLHRWLSSLPEPRGRTMNNRGSAPYVPREDWLMRGLREGDNDFLSSFRKKNDVNLVDGGGSRFPSSFFAIFTLSKGTCVFHGNFGKPAFAATYLVVGDDLPTTRGGKTSPKPPTVFTVVHQYTSDRIPRMMQLVSERYLKP